MDTDPKQQYRGGQKMNNPDHSNPSEEISVMAEPLSTYPNGVMFRTKDRELFFQHDILAMNDRKETFPITLLFRDRTGYRSINRILSEGYVPKIYPPAYSWRFILENRDGLLIGRALDREQLCSLSAEENVSDCLSLWYENVDFARIPTESELADAGPIIIGMAPRVSGGTSISVLESTVLTAQAVLDKMGIPVVGDCNTFHMKKERYDDFAYLGNKLTRKIVLENPKRFAAMLPYSEEEEKDTIAFLFPNAAEVITRRCREAAAVRYGDTIPAPVQNRLDVELERITRSHSDHSSRFLLAARLAEHCRKCGIPFIVSGEGAESLVAYLLGFTHVDPMPESLWNPTEKKAFTMGDSDPVCSMELPFTTLSLFGDKPFEMAVPNEKAMDEIVGFLEGLYGMERVYFAGKTGGDHKVHRTGNVVILDRKANVYDIAPVTRPEEASPESVSAADEKRMVTLPEAWFGTTHYALLKLTKDPVLEQLYDFSRSSGIQVPEEPVTGKDLAFLFREGIYQEIPVLSEFPESFTQDLYHCCFGQLVKYLGIRRFKKATADQLYARKQQVLDGIPLHEEEVMTLLMHHGVKADDAMSIATVVSYENVNPFPTEEDFQYMAEIGISEEAIRWIKGRRRLHKAQADAETAYHLLQLVWFRNNHPEVFFR